MRARLVVLRSCMIEGADRRVGEVVVCRDLHVGAELVTMGRADFADERTRARFTRRERIQWSPAGSARPSIPSATPTLADWNAASECDGPRRRWITGQ